MKQGYRLFFGALFPVTLLLVFILTWTFQVRSVGFYLDDWLYISAYHQGGFSALQAYAIDDSRPGLLPYVIGLGFELIGYDRLGWQLWSLFWRYLGGLGLWLLVRTVWPKRENIAVFSSILFAIFPFFKHQAFAIAYNQIWIQGALVTISFWLTACSLKTERRLPSFLFAAGAVTLSAIQLFMTEYYLPVEAARLVLILILTGERLSGKERVRILIRRFLPYALVLAAYLTARFVVMPRMVEDRNTLSWMTEFKNPFDFALYLIQMFFQYATEAIWGVWYRSIRPSRIDFSIVSQRIGLAAGLIVFLILALRARFGEDSDGREAETGESEARAIVYFGLILTLLGFLPGMAIDRNPSTDFLYHDRFLIPAFLGISLTIPAFFDRFLRGAALRTFLLAGLCAIAVNFQIVNSFDYRNAWTNQQNFQWQLYWRVPDAKPNTAFIGDGIIASFLGGWADGTMVLEMYGKGAGLDPTPYWYLVAGEGDFAHEFQNRLPLTRQVKIYDFRAEYGDNIVLTKGEWDRCLWVLEDLDQFNPYISPVTKNLIQYQNPDRIVYDSGWILNPALFGKDGHHDWCYAYEKAAAAVARGDYESALAYYQEAAANNWRPLNPTEFTPFIRAAARIGEWDLAAELTERAGWEPHITWEYFAALWNELMAIDADAPQRDAAFERAAPFIHAAESE